jgi:hypothetical protein
MKKGSGSIDFYRDHVQRSTTTGKCFICKQDPSSSHDEA